MKTIAEQEITGYFFKITASWSKFHNAYINKRTAKLPNKKLRMKLMYRPENPTEHILKFEGGPTGHEAYYVRDLLYPETFPKPTFLVICAGTINSWEKCQVHWRTVIGFLKSNGYEITK